MTMMILWIVSTDDDKDNHIDGESNDSTHDVTNENNSILTNDSI